MRDAERGGGGKLHGIRRISGAGEMDQEKLESEN